MCPDLEQLSAFIDGELSKKDSLAIETHLRKCDVCRAEIESFALISQEITRDIPSIPPGLEERIKDRVLHTNIDFRQAKKSSWFKGSISIPAPLAIAAGLVLLFTTTFTALNNLGGTGNGFAGGGSVALEEGSAEDQSPREVAMTLVEETEIEMEVPLDLDVDVDNIYFGEAEMIKEGVVLND